MDMDEGAVQRRSWRQRLRALLHTGTTPSWLGYAAALGAAMAVVPLPGLQTPVAIGLAWWLRLNLAVVVVVSNISFGPLLAFWWALAIAIGRFFLRDEGLVEAYGQIWDRFAATTGFRDLLQACLDMMVEWLLGCAVLMPILALVCGVLVFLAARTIQRRHAE